MKLLTPILLLLILLGMVFYSEKPSSISKDPIPLWKSFHQEAENSLSNGDLHGAANAYARAAQMAASIDDWQGLLEIACGVQRAGDPLAPLANSHAILLRAMLAAQRRQSAEGLQAVAIAFRSTGEWFASIALSHIHKNWFHTRATAGDPKRQRCWPELTSRYE